MDESANARNVVRFGVFEADLRSGELRKSGVRIRLREQAFQVLSELLERPGEVVTREELRDRLWPDGTFVDFDHSLNAAVNSIREVLGDSAANPRFVETLPRRGYRFIAPVERDGEPVQPPISRAPSARVAPEPATALNPAARPVDEAAEPTAPGKPRKRVRLRHTIWAVLLIAIGGLAAISYRLSNRPEPQVRPSPKKTYLTSYPLRELQPSFSPDGSQVTFAWESEGHMTYDIYVKLIGVEPPRRITTNPLQEYNPVWSPDGRWIAFLRRLEESNSEVWLVDPFGNRERKVAEVSVAAAFRSRHLAWSL